MDERELIPTVPPSAYICVHPRLVSSPFASLADVAKGGDGAKSAWRIRVRFSSVFVSFVIFTYCELSFRYCFYSCPTPSMAKLSTYVEDCCCNGLSFWNSGDERQRWASARLGNSITTTRCGGRPSNTIALPPRVNILPW